MHKISTPSHLKTSLRSWLNSMKMFSFRYTPLIVFVGFLINACTISEGTWNEMKSRLVTIRERDQRFRSKMDSVAKIEGWRSKKVADLYEQQRVLDSTNLMEIDKIITKFGYPPKQHVGDLSDVPFEVIRHSDDSVMNAYLPLIIGAGKNGDLRMDQVASFEDRVLVNQQQPQEYGTQINIDFKEDSATGQPYDSIYLWPIRDVERVEFKRASVGLDSLGKQLRRYGIDPNVGYLLRKKAASSR